MLHCATAMCVSCNAIYCTYFGWLRRPSEAAACHYCDIAGILLRLLALPLSLLCNLSKYLSIALPGDVNLVKLTRGFHTEYIEAWLWQGVLLSTAAAELVRHGVHLSVDSNLHEQLAHCTKITSVLG